MNPVNDAAFRASALSKAFRRNSRVLDGLELSVSRGRTLGLVGRNGSGKTTLLRCAIGLLRPDGGAVTVLGRRFLDAPPEHKARVAYVSQTGACAAWNSVRDMAEINALLYPRWDPSLLGRLVSRFDVPPDLALGRLSVGQRQMALTALAFATRPELLLLDEPAAGLDPVSCRHLLATIAEAVSELDGVTMIMSTHRLQDIERVADSVAVLREGKIVSHENLESLREEVRRIQIVFPGGVPDGFAVPGALRTSVEGAVVSAIVRLADEAPLNALRRMPGVTVLEHPVTLEDLFVEHYANPVREEN